ncbi:hypothetical protein [Sphingomonas sp. ERG5]|uniref:hypothetical protein n=1 Tax=Sphingomonas sp. ERG5 TaxID=1381597 RepID=UPI001364DBD6|nr:hypothetical protein [Sphingomonas sp. ERG5]
MNNGGDRAGREVAAFPDLAADYRRNSRAAPPKFPQLFPQNPADQPKKHFSRSKSRSGILQGHRPPVAKRVLHWRWFRL